MPAKKAKTETSEAPQGVDYDRYQKRLGNLPDLLKVEPQPRIEMAVEDLMTAIENEEDSKMMEALLIGVKTQVKLHGSEAHKTSMPERVRKTDPARQAHFESVDRQVDEIIANNSDLANLLVEVGFGMRAKKNDDNTLIPFSLGQLADGLKNKAHEARPYKPTPNEGGNSEVEG
jgi:hypothetical protein